MEKDTDFKTFLNRVIICTEYSYKVEELKTILKKKFELKYSKNFIQLLQKVLLQLLIQKKQHHL